MRTSAELARLRRRLTLLYTATATLGLVGLAAFTTSAEARLRAERADQELLGWASRAASLTDDANGTLDPTAIADDVLGSRVAWAAFDATDGLVEIASSQEMVGARDLAARSVDDIDERGTFATVQVDGSPRRAAAMPLFVGDEVRGAVVAAALPAAPATGFAWAVWATAGGLAAVSAGAGWWLAGRSIRPAAASLEHQEQFLAAAAHELRGPLARVRAVGEAVALLVDDRGTDDELAFEARRLRALSVEATTAVERLLLIARVDAGSVRLGRAPVELGPLVGGLIAERPDVEVEVPSGLSVVADRALLAVAIGNLLANAERHAAPGGGRVRIEAVETGDRVRITVSDQGPGFTDLAAVFERYHSGAPGGTGLGLWLVRWIAERHGGTVTAANRDGGGATVGLELPREAAAQPSGSRTSMTTRAGSLIP